MTVTHRRGDSPVESQGNGQTDVAPLGSMLRELADDVSELVTLELELAKTEMKAEVDKAKQTAMAGGLAAYFAGLAVLLLAFAGAWGLAEVMAEGFAFLIVAVVVGIAAAIFGLIARNRARTIDPMPRETVQTIEEDVRWLSQQSN
jgi:uncharacterized membrane protein YqjE